MSRGSLVALALVVALVASATACAGPAQREAGNEREGAATTSQAIIAGKPSANESVIQLAARDIEGADIYFRGCSGSLVAKNLVMTARHCVSDFDATTSAITSDTDASLFYVFAGQDAPAHLADGTAPTAQGKQLVVPESKSLLPDIAFIVLDGEITTAKVAALRLSSPAVKGEDLTLVGFGRTETGEFSAERRERKGVAVRGVGPFDGAFHSAGKGEFMVGEGACFGDSGGAAFSTKTGAIVGVTSRVQNGKDETTEEPSAPCLGPAAEDIYTEVAAMKAVVDRAFAAAGAKPILEAASSLEPSGGTLPTDPTSSKPPPDRRLPPSVGEDPPSESDSGCAASPLAPAWSGSVGVAALVVLSMLLARRRR